MSRLILSILATLGVLTLILTPTPPHAQTSPWHGLTVQSVSPDVQVQRKLMLPFGAVITAIRKDSPAARADLRINDVILAVGGQQKTTADDVISALNAIPPGQSVTLTRTRGLVGADINLRRQNSSAPPVVASPTPPVLMLDTGGHMAQIKDIFFTPDGKQLVSASNDKLIRIWDLAARKTVRTIRGEVATGSLGTIYAMALSGDGRWLAVGGWLNRSPIKGDWIRVYDFASGTLVRRLKGHRNVIMGLAFSDDGAQLISGSADRTAIVWQAPRAADQSVDWREGRIVHRLKGHTDSIYAVAFLPGGNRAVTASEDKTGRVWDVATGRHEGTLVGHRDHIDTISVSGDGTVATGDDSGEIRLWPASALATVTNGARITDSFIFQHRGNVGSLSFSPDGRALVATCGQQCKSDYRPHLFDVATGSVRRLDLPFDGIVLASTWNGDGRWIAAAGGDDKQIRFWSAANNRESQDENGKPIVLQGTGKPVWTTGISRDGRWIGWGNQWKRRSPTARGPIQYALRLPSADQGLGAPVNVTDTDTAVPSKWLHGTVQSGDLSMRHRRGGRPVRPEGALEIRSADGVKIIERSASNGFRHRAYSFTPDSATIISGASNGVLNAYTTDARPIGRFIGHEGDIWAVTPSPDGRFLVSGSADQTVRLWNIKTRELVVTLYHAPGPNGGAGDWVMWTPQGFYTGSPGGGRLVGWQINKGADSAADYVTGAQYRNTLNRRDIVERAIILASATAAAAELAPGFDLKDVVASLPPEIAIATPDQNAEAYNGRITVTAFVKPGVLALKGVEITVNGSKVRSTPAAIPADHPQPGPRETVYAYEIPLFNGWNDIELKARNAAGESRPASLRVHHQGEGALDKREVLRVVAIGVDDYDGLSNTCGQDGQQSCNLSFAGKDAKLFADTVVREMGRQHNRTQVRLLTNSGAPEDRPTRANILKALDEIALAGPNDTVVLFLAGHGETGRNGQYHFLPTDIRRGARAEPGTGENILPWTDIQDHLRLALGRRLLFLDACQSGAAHARQGYNTRLSESAFLDQFVAFTAAGPNQVAFEKPAQGHGLFTLAVAEGLKGDALDPTERAVRVFGLGNYVARRVRQLSGQRQSPNVYSGPGDVVLVRK